MGKKLAFIIVSCWFFSLAGLSQPVLFINAGSRASYGSNQELTIDARGNCRYYLREVNGPLKDSSFFSISQQQLDSLLLKADRSGFFNLNNKYNGNAVDGAGIYISINSSGKKHNVQMNNTDQPIINELVTLLNKIVEPYKIRINYGQFVIKQRK